MTRHLPRDTLGSAMDTHDNQNSDIHLDAPCPVEVIQEHKSKPVAMWSSGSEGSSTLFGTVVEHSFDRSAATLSPELSEGPLLDGHHGVEGYVSSAIETLEKRLEDVLESISDELTSEVIRERQHLLLMQEKVDMQGQTLQREFSELNKKMHQETTIRTMVQQKYREQNDALGKNLRSISKEISELKSALRRIETPWQYKAFNNLISAFQQCSGGSCHYERLGDDV